MRCSLNALARLSGGKKKIRSQKSVNGITFLENSHKFTAPTEEASVHIPFMHTSATGEEDHHFKDAFTFFQQDKDSNSEKPLNELMQSIEQNKKKLAIYQSHVNMLPHGNTDISPKHDHHLLKDSSMNALSAQNPESLVPESKVSLPMNENGIVPDGMEYYLMSEKQKSEAQGMSQRLNTLYNKIVTLSEDGETSVPKNLAELEKQYKEGVLMPTDQENDEFARTNKLGKMRTEFDRGFAYWKGKSRIDAVPNAEFDRMKEEKASLLAYHVPEFGIPALGIDPCPGCGAIFQDENESDFGFLTHEMIHKWVVRYSCIVKNRTEYAERRYRLFCHWSTNGKEYGDEWLDFMTQDEFNAFYVDKLKPAVCCRCRALQNFRTSTEDTVMSAPDFRKQLSALRDERGLFILVVDLFDFGATVIKNIQSLITMNNPILIVANKLDKVQKHKMEFKHAEAIVSRVSHGFYRAWIHDQLKAYKFPLHNLKDIVVVSAARGWYIRELAEKIEQLTNLTFSRAGRPQNAYLVGCTNVGKSSILNALAKEFSRRVPPHPDAYKEYYTVVRPDGTSQIQWEWKIPPFQSPTDIPHVRSGLSKTKANKVVTASPVPGTTIRMVGIPLTSDRNNITLYDTPGVIPEWQHGTVLNLREQAQCASPKRRFLVKYYKMAPGFTLFLSGLISIDIIDCHPSGLLIGLYLSPNVTHVRCPTAISEDMWRQHVGGILTPPYDPNTVSDGFSKKKKYFFECEKNVREPKADIYFHGLGWITLYSPTYDVILRVRTHKSVVHTVRAPLSTKELHRRHASLLKKASRHPNTKSDKNSVVHYWPGRRGCVTCHGDHNINATEPKNIQLADEPQEKPSMEKISKDLPPIPQTDADLDPTKMPWERIVASLKAAGKYVENE